MNRRANPHAAKAHCLTICPAKRISLAVPLPFSDRSPSASSKRLPSNQSHIARRFPSQPNDKRLQPPLASFLRRASGAVSPLPPNIVASAAPPFMRRASSTHPNLHPAPNRAHNPAFLLLRTSEMSRRTNPTPRNRTARQSAQRSASPFTAPLPFSDRSSSASSKRLPSNRSHTATAKKHTSPSPPPHGQRLKSPLPQRNIEAIPSAPASIPPALYNVC